MAEEVLPCCSVGDPRHVRDLEHFYGFDFDLFECPKCGRYWVWAWYEGIEQGAGAWEEIANEDGKRLATVSEPELRNFMKAWALKFD